MHDPHGAPPNPHALPPHSPPPHPASYAPPAPSHPDRDDPCIPPVKPPPPCHLTYPWQPRTPPPRRARPRRPSRPALGRHSDIRILRSAYKWLRRIATITALGYFTLFLVLSAYVPELMTLRVDGGLSIGLLFGVCQLPVTLGALAVYEWHARRGVDPLSERLRRQAESEARR